MLIVFRAALLCLTGAALRPGGVPGRRSPRRAPTATRRDAPPMYRSPPEPANIRHLIPPPGILPWELSAPAVAYSVYSLYGTLTSNGVDLATLTGDYKNWACALLVCYQWLDAQRSRDPMLPAYRAASKVLNRCHAANKSVSWAGDVETVTAVSDFIWRNPSKTLVLRDGKGTTAQDLVSNELRLKDRVLCLELCDGESFPDALASRLGMITSTDMTDNKKLNDVARAIAKHVASPYGVRPVIVYIRLDQVKDKTTREKALKDVQRFRTYGVDSVCTIVGVGKADVKATHRLEVIVAE